MLSPKESIVNMKLWRVSKSFYRVTKEVIPYQLTDGQIRVIELQSTLRRIEEGKPLETDDVPELAERQKMMLSKPDV